MTGTTRGWILRSEQAYCLQLCEKETLEYGIAYYSDRFGDHPDVNQFREVLIEDDAKVDEAVEQAEQWFRGRGLTCRRWATAECQDPMKLASSLEARGFRARSSTAMVLTQWVDLQAPASVRVLPARAMRAAFRQTFSGHELVNAGVRLVQVEGAAEERLNDAPYEMFVALIDRRPAGRCALYQVGDIARVMDFAVLPTFSDAGVGNALLASVLALAKRLTMRSVCALVNLRDASTFELLQRAGFVADGELVEFTRGGPASGSIV
jgi:N-acetylglutamate synthase-like GNAT family acetyltransferase